MLPLSDEASFITGGYYRGWRVYGGVIAPFIENGAIPQRHICKIRGTCNHMTRNRSGEEENAPMLRTRMKPATSPN